MGYVGIYSITHHAVCVPNMHETGLRVGIIGFLSPINTLCCSMIAVTDSRGSNAKGSFGAAPSSNFVKAVAHRFHTCSFKIH